MKIMTSRLSEKTSVLLSASLMLLIGIASAQVSKVAFILGGLLVVWGMYSIFKTKNEFNIAHKIVGFIVGGEVFFRMSKSGLPWEFGKFSVIFLLLIAIFVDNKKRNTSLLIILYMLLLLPALYLSIDYFIDFNEGRKAVFFSILGPVSIFISVSYFYNYPLKLDDFKILSRWVVMGALPMSTFLFFTVGDYSAIEFGGGSNAEASGGFTANQVSVGFGIGILFLLINLVFNQPLFYYKLLDVLVLVLFTFQGLMTFSRGGIMTTLVSVGTGLLIYYLSSIKQFLVFMRKKIILIFFASLIGFFTFQYVDDMTGGALYGRYFNKKADGSQAKEDLTTGRGDIVKGDLMLFESTDYTGIGIGVSKYERPLHRWYAPHVEYSRLLAEHGVLGLLALIILFVLPLKTFFERLNDPNSLLVMVSISMWALVTMTHAATRQGAVGFMYGLAFILLIKTINSKEKI